MAAPSTVLATPFGESRSARPTKAPTPRIASPASTAAARTKRGGTPDFVRPSTPPIELRTMTGCSLVLLRRPGARRPRLLDCDRHRARAGLLEGKGQRKRLTLAQRLVEPHQHDVQPTGVQHDSLTRR